jgi:hypothetical protein
VTDAELELAELLEEVRETTAQILARLEQAKRPRPALRVVARAGAGPETTPGPHQQRI